MLDKNTRERRLNPDTYFESTVCTATTYKTAVSRPGNLMEETDQ